jgi:hypothetical protein
MRRFGWLRASTPASSGAPPVKMKAPKGVAVFGDPSGMIDSTWAAAHRRGGELHMAARVDYCRSKFTVEHALYIGLFCTES